MINKIGGINLKLDLHVHTNHSDGLFSPKEVIDLAIKQNISGIAITDHDTISALDEALEYCKTKNFILIPGIEFGCVHNNEEVHILGYFIDYNNDELIKMVEKLRSSRVTRGVQMVEKISQLGLDITIEEVKEYSGEDYIGRPHIARVLMDHRYVTDIQDAFNKYLNRGKPGYVERFQLSVKDTIELIKRAGGIPILAHPGLLKDKEIINYAISMGIRGLECIHSKHTKNDTKFLKKLALAKDLIITGGSDFHGDNLILGDFYVNLEEIPEFKERIYYV